MRVEEKEGIKFADGKFLIAAKEDPEASTNRADIPRPSSQSIFFFSCSPQFFSPVAPIL
jgi:hypothetical protein